MWDINRKIKKKEFEYGENSGLIVIRRSSVNVGGRTLLR